MSSYVAAGIADSNMTKTSLIAMKLGVAGFILPFFFLNNPVLLYGSTEGVALSETIRAFRRRRSACSRLRRGFPACRCRNTTPARRCCAFVTRAMLVAGGLLFVNPTLFNRRGGARAHHGGGRDRPRGAPEGSAPDAAEGRRGREPLPLIPTPKEAIGVPDKQKGMKENPTMKNGLPPRSARPPR